MKTQWWLAELDMHGNPKLTDGAHSVRAGAEKALTLMQRLGLAKDRHFAIAEVRRSITGRELQLTNVTCRGNGTCRLTLK